MTHHFAMTSSLLIKILKIDKFGVFSSDIDFKTRWTYLEMIYPVQLTNVTSRRPKGASGGHKVSVSLAAQASEARLYLGHFKSTDHPPPI